MAAVRPVADCVEGGGPCLPLALMIKGGRPAAGAPAVLFLEACSLLR